MSRLFEPLVTPKDWLDQFLHAVTGLALTFLFSINIPLWAAAGLTLAIAVWREVGYQHWMTCNEGCRTDLAGWSVGILGGCALWYFLL